MTRIGDLTQSNQMLALVRAMQARIADTQLQAATGKRSQDYSGIAPDVPQLLGMEDARNKIARYIENIELADQRARLADFSIESMEKVAKQMKAELTANPQAYARLALVARDYLKSFADLVNQRDATRALFGGSNVAGPAVQLYEPGTADPAVPFAGVPGGNSYRYKILATGLASDTAMKVSDTLTVTHTVSANSPATNAFTKALDALIRIADFTTAVNPTPTQTNVDAAIADLDLARLGDTVAGYDGFDGLRGRIASARGALDLAKKSHENFLSYAEDVIGNAENADMTEVAVRLRSDEIQLQASYASLARITSITLLDFLL